jgi:hypothetical protein
VKILFFGAFLPFRVYFVPQMKVQPLGFATEDTASTRRNRNEATRQS